MSEPVAPGMQRIHVSIRTNNVGSECNDYFDIEADATADEIEEAARDAAFNLMEWDFRKEGDDD